MKKIVKLSSAADIQEEASVWIAKIDANNMSKNDQDALVRWLDKDVAHGKALMEMADLLDDMTVLSQLSELIPVNELSLSEDKNKSIGFAPSVFTPIRTLAYACMLAVIGFFSFQYIEKYNVDPVLSAATNIGEFKTISLPDNSKVTLNTYSHINVEFDGTERKVILTRGEAHFDVVEDKGRPFLVIVGDKAVKAVGTAFNVKTQGEDIEVTVTEGIVEIASIAAPSDTNKKLSASEKSSKQKAITRISAGHVVKVAGEVGSLKAIDPVSVDKKLAWQKGMVVFEGETLEEVIEEISRYTTSTFIITDEEARNIRVGGYFEIGDIQKMLDILKHGFNIAAETSLSGTIYLSYLEQEDGEN